MRQALHIFLKDSRQFRYPIGLLLAWTGLFAFSAGEPWPSDLPFEVVRLGHVGLIVQQLAPILFVGGWCCLVAQVVHADALSGERPFWLTRPYRRGSLAAAKALFVLAYVLVPFAVAQAVIVVSSGVPLGPVLTRLLWEQLLVAVIVVVPTAMVAAVTASLPQFVLALLLVAVAVFVPLTFGALDSWGPFDWVRNSVILGGSFVLGACVLVIQYARRRTARARVLGLGGVLALLVLILTLPWPAAHAFQARVANEWEGTLTAALAPPVPSATGMRPIGPRGLQLTFRFSGGPDGAAVVCEARQITLESANGRRWQSRTSRGVTLMTPESGCPVGLPVPASFLDAVGAEPVTLRAELYNTVFGPPRSVEVPLDTKVPTLTDFGACVASRRQGRFDPYVECRDAFREPRQLRWSAYTRRPGYSPFPADFRIYPVVRQWLPVTQPVIVTDPPSEGPKSVTLATRDPIAHVVSTVVAENLRLSDYEFRR